MHWCTGDRLTPPFKTLLSCCTILLDFMFLPQARGPAGRRVRQRLVQRQLLAQRCRAARSARAAAGGGETGGGGQRRSGIVCSGARGAVGAAQVRRYRGAPFFCRGAGQHSSRHFCMRYAPLVSATRFVADSISMMIFAACTHLQWATDHQCCHMPPKDYEARPNAVPNVQLCRFVSLCAKAVDAKDAPLLAFCHRVADAEWRLLLDHCYSRLQR